MQLRTEIYRSLRKVLGTKVEDSRTLQVQHQGQAANDLVRETLLLDQPCMIGRFGSNELDATIRAFEQRQQFGKLKRVFRYLRGYGGVYWWDSSIRKRMHYAAGFFPATDDYLRRFGERILDDCSQLDVLGSWCRQEWRLRPLFERANIVDLIDLEPFRHQQPWSMALRGQKVLVVHPFEESIRKQYEQRHLLFKDPNVLPDFELLTLKSVQSSGSAKVPFGSWFDALDHMCQQIDELDFDIAVIGAGAYGFPLAAHVKRMNRKAVHLGGATQLLFGIRGKRWDNGAYDYVINENWCRPLEAEKPPRADLIEQGIYW